MINFFLVSILFFGITTLQAQETPPLQYPFEEPGSSPRGVFGEDGRKEIKDAEGFEDFARATAVMIPKEEIKGNRIYGYSLRELLAHQFDTEKFNDNVKFLDQPTAASCTGFLIAPDLLVTAGHCIKTIEDAANWVWLFDYTNDLSYNEEDRYVEVNKNNLYEVSEVLVGELNDDEDDKSLDYSVLKLDRKSDRRPYRFRTSGVVAEGSDIYTIGAPTGLPLKLSTESTVVDNTATSWFKSDIDAFPGNSGGPVFDSNGFIEGILVRGAVEYSNGNYTGDYKYDQACDCVKTVTFQEVDYTAGCQAHKITYLPEEIVQRAIYNNIAYSIKINNTDRYEDWSVYSWMFTSNYAKERGRLEDVAIHNNNYQVLENLLVKYGEDYSDDYVRTLLEGAIDSQNTQLLDILLTNELDPDASYTSSLRLIQKAVKDNNVLFAQRLINSGAQVTIKDIYGNTLLHDAAGNGNTEVVKMLLAKNVSAKSKNNAGYYPEKVAKKAGYKMLAKTLKEVRKEL